MATNQSTDYDVGQCCSCEGVDGVRNIIMLNALAPVPGTGWGCVVCHLPSNGAMAVLCDRCIDLKMPIIWAVTGYLPGKQRIPRSELVGKHEHDLSFHPEVMKS